MLAWFIAAACMWRGLTNEEADAVEQEVRDYLVQIGVDPETVMLSAGQARDLIDSAIAVVLERTRP